MSHYEIEYLRRTLIDAAQSAIAAAAVGVFPDTQEHRTAQLKAMIDTLTPQDVIELLKH